MAKFTIVQKDPTLFKEEIIQFWQNYLPGTPPERFNWMNANPAGAPIWFFAFNHKLDELAGTISIMPKDLFIEGKRRKAGIMGDFMIADKYRAFGPALMLMKSVIENTSRLGFDLIYTIPNAASKKIIERVGLKKTMDLNIYVRPIHSYHYLNKKLPEIVARKAASILDLSLHLLSREKFYLREANFRHINQDDSIHFNKLWERIKNINANPASVFNSEYIRWHFLKNPLHEFRIISYQPVFNKVEGYISIAIDEDTAAIHHLKYTAQKAFDLLLSMAIKLATKENLRSIYLTVPDKPYWHRILRSFAFLDTKSKMELYSWSPLNLSIQDWSFFDGDRNI
jgi:hypothetical protein